MIKSLWTAKTGLESQQVKMDVISNNLANVSTNGFKKSRAVFEDLLYQNLRQPGGANDVQNTLPSGMQVGSGVRPVATERLHSQGGLENTGNSRDLAINGNGFLQVNMPDGTIGYTRDGSPAELVMPTEPGEYEIRYYLQQDASILARVPITLTAAGATLDVPAEAAVGSTIPVGWTGPDYQNDYIGIGRPGVDHGRSLRILRQQALLLPAGCTASSQWTGIPERQAGAWAGCGEQRSCPRLPGASWRVGSP